MSDAVHRQRMPPGGLEAKIFDSYAKWLKDEGYQPSTIQLTLRHTRRLKRNPKLCVLEHNAPHVRRYMRFVKATKHNPCGLAALRVFKKHGFEASAKIEKTGSRIKPALTPVEFALLRSRLRRGKDAVDRLLVGYMQQRLRINEFLLHSPHRLVNDLEPHPDKITRDWLLTFAHDDAGYQPVYLLICDTRRCAYFRMRRRLLEVAESLGLEVDFHALYRRRTAV